MLWIGCKEKYPLPKTLVDKNYLVVEGFINNGNDLTEIKLSRTVRPEDDAYILPEQHAMVRIVGENGEVQNLYETTPGTYQGGPYFLDPSVKYGIKINTAGGKEYQSDFTEVKYTPPIDSISWLREESGVRIYANTHDPENKSKYYTWQFEETWDFYSYEWSSYEYVEADTSMISRADPNSIYHCWQSNKSTSILIGSSAKLSEDILYMAPLTFIPDDSWKISSLYSILVKQRVLSKGAFEYLEKMKKNSEQLGTIFDPQPSSNSGNIRCTTDPSEIVIGYIYISSTQEKRIFIRRGEVPGWKYRFFCEPDTIRNVKDSLAMFFSGGGLVPIGAIKSMIGTTTHYSAASTTCMDCRLRGTNVKPDFWP
ncbi:MAG: DUF4249 domain-containing protein [Chitinophagaceae bacterium]|nr:DUF4249 domain-containing protein [Chitinophagaceae bacterium]